MVEKKGIKNLIKILVNDQYIKSEKVYNVMLNIDRSDYIDYEPYLDCPQTIGFGATISAPHMHAFALENLKDYLIPGGKVLDVGFGSGYLITAFSKMMDDAGLVVGIEHIPELCEKAYDNIAKSNKDLLDSGKAILIEGDGRKGCDKFSKYNCIHVGAAADSIPEDLVNQLLEGGRMMIPVGKQTETQYICLVDKDNDGKVTTSKVLPVRYIPLTNKEKQLKNYI